MRITLGNDSKHFLETSIEMLQNDLQIAVAEHEAVVDLLEGTSNQPGIIDRLVNNPRTRKFAELAAFAHDAERRLDTTVLDLSMGYQTMHRLAEELYLSLKITDHDQACEEAASLKRLCSALERRLLGAESNLLKPCERETIEWTLKFAHFEIRQLLTACGATAEEIASLELNQDIKAPTSDE